MDIRCHMENLIPAFPVPRLSRGGIWQLRRRAECCWSCPRPSFPPPPPGAQEAGPASHAGTGIDSQGQGAGEGLGGDRFWARGVHFCHGHHLVDFGSLQRGDLQVWARCSSQKGQWEGLLGAGEVGGREEKVSAALVAPLPNRSRLPFPPSHPFTALDSRQIRLFPLPSALRFPASEPLLSLFPLPEGRSSKPTSSRLRSRRLLQEASPDGPSWSSFSQSFCPPRV